MWEICFERGAQSIFRLSGEIFRQTEKMGMMCTAYGGQPRQEDSISSKTVTEESEGSTENGAKAESTEKEKRLL